MPSSEPTLFRPGILLVLVGVGALVISDAPMLALGEYRVSMGLLIGVLSGLCLLVPVISHYRNGETRESLQWGLFAVGIPLSLLNQAILSWLGLLVIAGSLGIGWGIDRRIRGRISA
ncbi:hypothetical protein SAMN04488065_3031 [Haloplanus vescus]|uniref:Uncharacterized protein n=1 Tax=Haloplanus vescus TaxID=555874 RepID=A0A1H4AX48_9EURY|nr:hypothetical protein [Haloplanus vescus]SEA40493.1 hypothetical protein SAMN04488065_3031 [Haloplanus vescus]